MGGSAAADSGTYTTIRSLEVYRTDNHRLELTEIRNLTDSWQELNDISPNFGFTEDVVWGRVELSNPRRVEDEFYFQIRWPLLTTLHFYDAHLDQGEIVYRRIDPVTYRFPMFKLELRPRETRVVYFKVASNALLNLPLNLSSSEAFLHDLLPELVIIYGAVGLFVAVVLYNSFLVLGTRESVYQFYVLYFVSVFGLLALVTGLVFQWGADRSGVLATHGFQVAVCLSQAFGGIFCLRFLNLKRESPILYRIILSCIYGWFTMFVLTFWVPLNLLRFPGVLLTIILCPTALIAGIILWRRGFVYGRYFTMAWSVLLVTASDFSLIWVGADYNEFRHSWLLVIGTSAEAMILSLGLAERINEQKRQSDRLQRQLLEHQQQANLVLENQVKERTDSLNKALIELEVVNQELAELTETDALTGVKNRRVFDRVLADELAWSRHNQVPISLIILDIDHFKEFNDKHGHLVGDACLQHVAKLINSEINRSGDLFARYGGEEFAVILHNTGKDGCESVATRLCKLTCKSSFINNGEIISVTASFGCVSLIADEQTDAKQIIAKADDALYLAKQSGRNCVKMAD